MEVVMFGIWKTNIKKVHNYQLKLVSDSQELRLLNYQAQ